MSTTYNETKLEPASGLSRGRKTLGGARLYGLSANLKPFRKSE